MEQKTLLPKPADAVCMSVLFATQKIGASKLPQIYQFFTDFLVEILDTEVMQSHHFREKYQEQLLDLKKFAEIPELKELNADEYFVRGCEKIAEALVLLDKPKKTPSNG